MMKFHSGRLWLCRMNFHWFHSKYRLLGRFEFGTILEAGFVRLILISFVDFGE